ncbi:hypothetical protein SMSP1_00601 [Sedimentisphaera salicampi]|nr:hypothetical protein SMSP1_00601 [Sedimentisphaera salicampi]
MELLSGCSLPKIKALSTAQKVISLFSRKKQLPQSLMFLFLISSVLFSAGSAVAGSEPRSSWSGVYPHLAYFNDNRECGTGAVVPWANRLWVVTYAPHSPKGSDGENLYEIDGDLNLTAHPESIGGTPAARMIHRESNQLFIGPYVVDDERNVRVIPYSKMMGRHTGIARHLFEPSSKVYYATMEEGLYEVNVNTLEVNCLIRDGNSGAPPEGIKSDLPGYHGKGLYLAQDRLVYANNGQKGPRAKTDPTIPSGALAEWYGQGDWQLVRRDQFTEVTGPGGIYGNSNSSDQLWSIGWDQRSLILALLDNGQWSFYRLPKASHTYDGAHGWNTEWPRIRDIGEEELLMNMHGMFWQFPKSFSREDRSGIRPMSTYLMVLGDFAQWREKVVLGCNVTARSEFLNTLNAKGDMASPGQSQSNLRFISSDQLDSFGKPIGRGAVWLNDSVKKQQASDPYLFAGFENRSVHLVHQQDKPVEFIFEVDKLGDGSWEHLKTVTVDSGGYKWTAFSASDKGEWIRVHTNKDCERVTVFFQYSSHEKRTTQPDKMFDGIAKADSSALSGGYIRARGENKKTLQFSAKIRENGKVKNAGYYEMMLDSKGSMILCRVDDEEAHAFMQENMEVPRDVISVDQASLIYVDEKGKRFRLPKGDKSFDKTGPVGLERISREVVTERDLFNAHGTFYELPAKNAGGFSKIRPVATHNRRIADYCSWRGLLILSGIADNAPESNKHIIRSEDGKVALWVGAVDDLWEFGKPVGRGGPWKDTHVKAGEPSDPYLMTGYEHKTLELSHKNDQPVEVCIEVDIDGQGTWKTYRKIQIPADCTVKHRFPEGFNAYWVRTTADTDTVATAYFIYE